MYLYVKLNRDANCFLPVESKDCINSHMSGEICRLEERHNWFKLEYRLSAGTPIPQNHENVVYQKLKHLDEELDLGCINSNIKWHSDPKNS